VEDRRSRQRTVSVHIRKQQVLGSNPSVGSSRSRVKAGLRAGFRVTAVALTPEPTPGGTNGSRLTVGLPGDALPRSGQYLADIGIGDDQGEWEAENAVEREVGPSPRRRAWRTQALTALAQRFRCLAGFVD
jgi:hypothetical protein